MDGTQVEIDELRRLGLYDPDEPGAEDRLELIRFLVAHGAALSDIAASTNLGAMALDRAVRPRGTQTLAEAAEERGIEITDALKLLGATGLRPDPQELMTLDEVVALELLHRIATQFVDFETALHLARVAGLSMSRLAEAVTSAFRVNFELPLHAAGKRYAQVVESYSQIANALLPQFMRALDVLLRRQIVTIAARVWSTDEDQTTITVNRTIGFVDLVGYTQRASGMSVGELATVMADFEQRSSETIQEGNAWVIKTIGDETMFAAQDPVAACEVALSLVRTFGRGDAPPVRVGLACGEVVSVLGDLYGIAVNLAARLVAVAEPSSVVVSEDVRKAIERRLELQSLGSVALKGFTDPVEAYRLIDSHASVRRDPH